MIFSNQIEASVFAFNYLFIFLATTVNMNNQKSNKNDILRFVPRAEDV